MSELVIDQGNSFTKLTLFHDQQIKDHVAVPDQLLPSVFDQMYLEHSPKNILFSTVRKNSDTIISKPRNANWIVMHHSLKFPFESSYLTPETLGHDRLANVAGACRRFGKKNILIVDCGTCITYSLVTDRTFRGGAIAPGLNMRFKALNHFTGRLPLLEPSGMLPEILGNSTETSIRSGVERAIILETDAIIQEYCSKIPGLIVTLTGGAIQFFEQHLKSPIFAAPYLTPEGLHEILLLNAY